MTFGRGREESAPGSPGLGHHQAGYGGYGVPRQRGPGYGMPGDDGARYQGEVQRRGQLRAADADRERALEYLKTAFTEGRLTQDDYEARMERALAAKTFADLDALLADLPVATAPGHWPAQPRTNPLAIASLVCGVGQFALWPLITIPAIVLGHMARRQIRRTGEAGSGIALAGLLLGWAGAAIGLLALIGGLLLIVAVTHSAVTH